MKRIANASTSNNNAQPRDAARSNGTTIRMIMEIMRWKRGGVGGGETQVASHPNFWAVLHIYIYTYIYVYIQACVVHRQAAVFLQGAGRQIGVLVFDLAIEGKPPFIFVVGEKRFQREHFAQRETWPH